MNLIPIQTTIDKNGMSVPTRNMIFGGDYEQENGMMLNGLLHDPRSDPMSGGLNPLQMIGEEYNIANQNEPCVTNSNTKAMVSMQLQQSQNVTSEDSMVAQPFSVSRLNHVGLAHQACDIETIGNDVRLRSSNAYNFLLKPPFPSKVF